jgi:hypothetical protein
VFLPPISLERTLQVLVREDRKSRPSDYFFCIGIIRFGLALHMMSFPYCIIFLIIIIIKNIYIFF